MCNNRLSSASNLGEAIALPATFPPLPPLFLTHSIIYSYLDDSEHCQTLLGSVDYSWLLTYPIAMFLR